MLALKFFYIVFLLVLSCCGNNEQARRDSIKTLQSENKINKTQSPYHDNKKKLTPLKPNSTTTILALIAPEGYIHASGFNRWNELPKTHGRVHLFAHDANHLQKLDGIKHQVAKKDLADELGRQLLEITSENLIIFIPGHGDYHGNICYTSRNICDVTEDVLLDALKHYVKQNKKNTLKHLLVVPLSCYNKKIMERFLTKLDDVTWPFHISVLLQKFDYSCGSQSVAQSLFEQEITLWGKAKHKDLDSFLKITTLDQLVELINSMVVNDVQAFEKLLAFELRHYKAAPPIDLDDFGFDVLLSTESFSVQEETLDFPNQRSVESLLQQLLFPDRFYPHIKSLHFYLATNTDNKDLVINGDVSTIINFPDVTQKAFLINVRLSRKI